MFTLLYFWTIFIIRSCNITLSWVNIINTLRFTHCWKPSKVCLVVYLCHLKIIAEPIWRSVEVKVFLISCRKWSMLTMLSYSIPMSLCKRIADKNNTAASICDPLSVKQTQIKVKTFVFFSWNGHYYTLECTAPAFFLLMMVCGQP